MLTTIWFPLMLAAHPGAVNEAGEEAVTGAVSPREEEQRRQRIALKPILVFSMRPDPSHQMVAWGMQLMYERTLGHGVDLELAAAMLAGTPSQAAFPVDVLIKTAWELGDDVEVYVGGGPVVSVEVEMGEPSFTTGGIVSLGGYWWLSDSIGFVMEIDGGLLVWPAVRGEIETAMGWVARF